MNNEMLQPIIIEQLWKGTGIFDWSNLMITIIAGTEQEVHITW